ncbi:hypothetical protein [Aeromonas phage 25AhydR2PP]|uniref:Uncharacterized protein n=1 Tax=Aeromonas phage 25AhydR2PP TaxID=2163976 RepID=A0A3G6V683_9CAUD|nr:hypothetical protein HOT20_gp42 [Aeromonas phage 25AhydR2PP]AZB48862.1 hypothetical protein [Aeromonas phage 25AhydR2PP]
MHRVVCSLSLYCLSPIANKAIPHDFKQGLGPCGKVVTSLQVEKQVQGISVLQFTECGECKEFYYPYSQIAGRITITTKESPK